MKTVDELRRETLIKAGWKSGEKLPSKLTTPSVVFRQDNDSFFFSERDVLKHSRQSLSLKELFDDPIFPLGSNHPKYIGHTWINIFDRLDPRDGQEMQRHLDNGLDMEKVLADLNKGSYDGICLYSCAGCYAVETGNHRMAYLKVLYETLMENPDITREEKFKIQDLRLNVSVKELNYNIYPEMGGKHFTAPSFLPEMVEAEQKALAEARNLAVSEATETIFTELADVALGFDLKQKINGTLTNGLLDAPSNLKKLFDDICVELRTPSPEQKQVMDAYQDGNDNIYKARKAIGEIETHARNLEWEIQGLRTSLNDQANLLNSMPNPKLPSGFIARQFDTKAKQAQRLNYANQWNTYEQTNQNIHLKEAQLAELGRNKIGWEKYLDDRLQFLNGISDKFNAACDSNNKAHRAADKVAQVSKNAIVNLSKKLKVPDPYQRGIVVTTYRTF